MMRRRDVIAEAALQRIGCGYLMGATGQVCTQAVINSQARQYPAYADRIEQYGSKWLRLRVYDCAQLTRAAYAAGGIKLPSGATSQYGAGVWRRKGVRGSLPDDRAGYLLFVYRDNRMQHVMVTVGNGYMVDARGHASGVLFSRSDDYAWTDWCEPEGLDDMIDESELLAAPTLQRGARGLAVGVLQRQLIQHGLSVGDTGVDTVFGATTLASVRELQRDRGLTVDGIVGKATWAALGAQAQPGTPVVPDAPASPERYMIRNGASGETVIELQGMLVRLGYDVGSTGVDGKFGARTASAVRAFQTSTGLAVDGIVGPKTWAALDAAVTVLEPSDGPQEPETQLYDVRLVGVTADVAQHVRELFGEAIITEH